MEENKQTIFRNKTLSRISSPEQLSDYLRVTDPGIWIILAAVIALLTGLFVWSAVGTLETTVDAKVIVVSHQAQVIPSGSQALEKGMTLRVSSEETVIESATQDEYGRPVGTAGVSLPDGSYDGIVVTERTRPISFLLESR